MSGTTRKELVDALDGISENPVVQFHDDSGKPYVQLRLEPDQLAAGRAIVDQLGVPVKQETLTYRLNEGPDFNVMLLSFVTMEAGMLLLARDTLALLDRLGDSDGYEVLGSRQRLPADIDAATNWEAVSDYPAGTLAGYLAERVMTAAKSCAFAQLPDTTPSCQVLAALLTDSLVERGWERGELFEGDHVDEVIAVLEQHTRTARALEPKTISIPSAPPRESRSCA